MDIVSKITQAVEPSLSSLGYAIVQVKFADGARRKTLTIMAERADGTPMGFDDCTEISRTVGALLEVEDPITTAYDLEVCSPGLDRPLTRIEDYTRFAGQDAKVETMIPIDGRKRFRGVIKAVKGEAVTLVMPEGNEVEIVVNLIRTAKLVAADVAVPKNKKGAV